MTDVDTRLVFFVVWGFGVVLAWGSAFYRTWQSWRLRKDRRSISELLTDGALFVCAVGAAFATLAVLFGEGGSSARSFAVSVALGAFFAAGLVRATIRGSIH